MNSKDAMYSFFKSAYHFIMAFNNEPPEKYISHFTTIFIMFVMDTYILDNIIFTHSSYISTYKVYIVGVLLNSFLELVMFGIYTYMNYLHEILKSGSDDVY